MSTAAESPPWEATPPESPSEGAGQAGPTGSAAGRARSGADDGWAVPGVTAQKPTDEESAGSDANPEADADPDVDADNVALLLTAGQASVLANLSAAVAAAAEMASRVSGVESLTVARQVHRISNRISGVHARLVATANSGQAWTGDGFLSAPRWLAETHLMSGRTARDRVVDADWLIDYPVFAGSLGAGRISAAHVTVTRRITSATRARRAAFVAVAKYWVTVAQGRDPDTLAALLRAWAALVDDTEDDAAEKAWRSRALRVTAVGDEWAISGRLPAVEGARLSGVLNALMDIDRRGSCSCDQGACSCPEDDRTITQRRADALLAIVDAVTARTPMHRSSTQGPTQSAAQANAAAAARCDADAQGDAQAGPEARPAADVDVGAGPATGAGPEPWPERAPEPWPDSSPPREPGSSRWRRPGSDWPPSSDPDAWPGLAPGWNSGRLGDRTRVVLVIRAEDLNPPVGIPGPIPGPATRPEDVMSTWATANGPGTGLLARTTMLRELCDTTVQRLIVGPDSQPLDIGRATRTIPAQLRTALHVRDRGCVFPGCDRPPGWTEAHHIETWAAGGVTAIRNLASLCSRHHHLIHTPSWNIQMGGNGHPVITRARTYPKRR
ncbi:MAG: hypothetical protein QG597_2584 [Actinomycetota bacterium]|nr:hypothetical protein [Actinomycetota bacterium]